MAKAYTPHTEKPTPVYSYIYISNMKDIAIPVKHLRLNRATNQLEEYTPTSPFLKGPIPMDWLSSAAKLSGKTLSLGIAIWWLHGMSNGCPFKLTKTALTMLNLSKDTVRDGLKKLEVAGLIKVSRSPGQRPLLEVNPAPPPKF